MKILLFMCLALFSAIAMATGAAADQACFYPDANWMGRGFCAPPGQEARDLSTSGFSNRLSSLTIVGDAYVILYTQVNFTGRAIRVDTSIKNFNQLGYNVNDGIKSLKILKNTVGRVCFYEDSNFGGRSWCGGPRQQNSDLTTRDMNFNDKISSIKIEGDASIFVYEDTGFRGKSQWIRNTLPNVGSFWNDRISSFKIGMKNSP
jgi:hypothetical protein